MKARVIVLGILLVIGSLLGSAVAGTARPIDTPAVSDATVYFMSVDEVPVLNCNGEIAGSISTTDPDASWDSGCVEKFTGSQLPPELRASAPAVRG